MYNINLMKFIQTFEENILFQFTNFNQFLKID